MRATTQSEPSEREFGSPISFTCKASSSPGLSNPKKPRPINAAKAYQSNWSFSFGLFQPDFLAWHKMATNKAAGSGDLSCDDVCSSHAFNAVQVCCKRFRKRGLQICMNSTACFAFLKFDFFFLLCMSCTNRSKSPSTCFELPV